MQLDATQLAAVDAACSRRLSIITGGAGTGKTTIIAAITEQLEKRGERVALAAFAGKAAARVREACRHPASTIHRLLGYNGKTFLNPSLDECSLIVDESSMVDSALLAEIVQRNPKRLTLVGDAAQLPPVGRGQPFHDLIALRPELVSTLSTCYRATEAVFRAANTIRAGGRPPLYDTSEGERWNMMNTGNAQRTQDQILEWISGDTFDFEKDIILVARNGESDDEPCTVRGLNKAIAAIVLPERGDQKICVGDRVINTHNIPELDVWNGTTGTVHAIDIDKGVWVRTDLPVIDQSKTSDADHPVYTNHVLFSRDNRKHLQLAYALTTHKAQGSQYRNVCVACFNRDTWGLLDRSLLYTAVTRTKEACVVVGELSAAFAAIDKVDTKRTVIQLLAEGSEG